MYGRAVCSELPYSYKTLTFELEDMGKYPMFYPKRLDALSFTNEAINQQRWR